MDFKEQRYKQETIWVSRSNLGKEEVGSMVQAEAGGQILAVSDDRGDTISC